MYGSGYWVSYTLQTVVDTGSPTHYMYSRGHWVSYTLHVQ